MKRVGIGLVVVALGLLATGSLSAARPFPPEPHDPAGAALLQNTARVILITLDGPIPDNVLTGPHFRQTQESIRHAGLAFPARATSFMALSLPGYMALAAGHEVACLDNDCPRIETETMAEAIARRLNLAPEQVALFASWSKQRRAFSSQDGHVWVDGPFDQGPQLDEPSHEGTQDDGPPWPNARWDSETFERARAHWQTHHPRFLHLAFLDTDELAHMGRHADYDRALDEADSRVQEVLRWVAALPPDEQRHTTVLLTSDHGRGTDWTRHGPYDRGSGDIFFAAIGGEAHPAASAESLRFDHRDLRPTVERLLGLCPAHERWGGRALQVLVDGLPCAK